MDDKNRYATLHKEFKTLLDAGASDEEDDDDDENENNV